MDYGFAWIKDEGLRIKDSKFGVCPREDVLDLVGVDRLLLEQHLRHQFNRLCVAIDDPLGVVVAAR